MIPASDVLIFECRIAAGSGVSKARLVIMLMIDVLYLVGRLCFLPALVHC